jgi:hypothetical protein
MPPREGQPATAVVQITCDSVLPEIERAEFDGWDVTYAGRTTMLTARGVDQAALHGALDRLARLGLHVVEVSRRPKASS